MWAVIADQLRTNTMSNQTTLIQRLVNIDDRESLIAEGPLGLQCAKALQDLYGKDIDKETGLVLETQVTELEEAASLWQVIQTTVQKENTDDVSGMIYSVDAGEVKPSDIMRAADTYSRMAPSERAISAVHMPNPTLANSWAEPMRQMADQYGVLVISDVREYLASRSAP